MAGFEVPTEVKRFTYESNKTTRMNETVGFLLRLQVKIGKALTTDQACLSTLLAGREIKIKSSNDQPLSKTKWIVLESRGFATETEARDFGEQLRSIVQIAALCSHLGADAGLDKTIGWVNEDLFRSEGFLEPHRRFGPSVHGLLILPDDDNTLFLHMEAAVTVTADPDQFIGAMEELAGQLPLSEPADTPAVRLLNLALINPQVLAKIVLAFSAIEALGQDETWTPAQVDLIKKLAIEIENNADGDGERLEVAAALRRSLHRIGLRQGVKRLLCCHDIGHLQKEWDRLYGLRSGLFHGTVPLKEHEVNQLASDTVKLCSRIILALIQQDGIKLPSVASKHFGEI